MYVLLCTYFVIMFLICANIRGNLHSYNNYLLMNHYFDIVQIGTCSGYWKISFFVSMLWIPMRGQPSVCVCVYVCVCISRVDVTRAPQILNHALNIYLSPSFLLSNYLIMLNTIIYRNTLNHIIYYI
ncbi:hypothetical protein PUN28_001814 [Cardiocondyla obscurior]|uniref:Uncharacterized protein n=1 Tax=Cardiocondyla obscurior TaxID=286306 RepID=A0AAW2GRA5_9HYME